MRVRSCVCVSVAVIVLLGCGGGGGGTPKATFEAFKAAMSDKNFADAWEQVSAETQRLMNEDAAKIAEEAVKSEGPARIALEKQAKAMGLTLEKMKKLDGKALFIGAYTMTTIPSQGGREQWQKVSRAQFSRVEQEGARAKVYVKLDGKEDTDRPLQLVLEDGTWRVDLTEPR